MIFQIRFILGFHCYVMPSGKGFMSNNDKSSHLYLFHLTKLDARNHIGRINLKLLKAH